MNKFVASVGMIAVGASGVQAVHAQGVLGAPASKPWSIHATLRGFYDDNIATQPSGPNKVESFGFQITPGANLNWMNDQTTVALGYDYTYKYFDKKVFGFSRNENIHLFNASLTHSFSERYKASLNDSFVIGQEPDLLQQNVAYFGGYAYSTFQRVSGDNIHNSGAVQFNAQLTPLFGANVGYNNNYWKYHSTGVYSPGALLNRIENIAFVEGTWQAMPETTALLGYQFEQVGYTEDNSLLQLGSTVTAKQRDNRQHYIYAGLDHTFLPNLSGKVRVGGTYTDFYNDPSGRTQTSPYALASLRYNYAEESYAEAGFSYSRNATDLIGANASGSSFVTDEESAVLFASVNHRIMPNLYGSLMGQFQNSTLHGGTIDGQTERFYLLGLDIKYKFNQYLAADVGYDYDKLDSEVGGRSFSRNRVYMGVTASY